MKFDDLTDRATFDALTLVIKDISQLLNITLMSAKSYKDDLGLRVYDFYLTQPLPEKNLKAFEKAIQVYFNREIRIGQYPPDEGVLFTLIQVELFETA